MVFLLLVSKQLILADETPSEFGNPSIVSLKRIIKDIHKASINDVEYDPLHNYFVTASNDDTIGIFDFNSGENIDYIQEFYNDVRDISLSPDYSLIAIADDGGYVSVYKYPEIVVVKSIYAHNDSVSSVEFNFDGTKLISAGDDGCIKIWDVEDNLNSLQIIEAHQNFISNIAIDQSFNYIVSASEDNTIKIYSNSAGEFIHTLKGHIDYVKAVDISADGLYTVSGDDSGKIFVWETKTGEILYELNYHRDYIRSIDFSPDAKAFVVACDDRTVSLWETSSGKLLTLYAGFSDWVYDAKIIKNSSFIISVNDNNEAVILPMSELAYYIAYANRNFITSYKYKDESYGNKYIEHLGTLKLKDKTGISKIQHSIKAERVAISYFSGNIELLRMDGGNKLTFLKRFKAHGSNITFLKISDNGEYLVSACIHGQVKIWDINGNYKYTILNDSYISELHITPDSNYILLSDLECNIKLINITNGKIITKKELASLVKTIAIDKQNRFLFIGYTNNTSEVLTYPELKKIAVIETDAPVSVAIIYNNQIITSNLNGGIELFLIKKSFLGKIFVEKIYNGIIFDKLTQMHIVSGKDGNNYIITLSESRNIILWKLTSHKCYPISKISISSQSSWNIAFSINDMLIIAGNGESIMKTYQLNL